MKLIKSVLLIALFLLMLNQAFSLSATLGNSRVILRPDIIAGEETKIERSLFIKNANEFPVVVTLSVDEKYSKIISFTEKEYALSNNAEINAPFAITLKEEGYYDIKIFVLFKPNDANVKDSPVGLTSNVIIITSGYTGDGSEVDGGNTTTPTTTPPTPANGTVTPTTTPANGTVTPTTTPTTIPASGGMKQSFVIGIIIALAVLIIGGIFAIIILRKVM